MTIYFNPATEKYPAKLNIETERLTVADIIGIKECVVLASDSSIDFVAILSDECVGIQSKEKNFQALNKKCKFSLYKDKKQQYSVDEKKYIDTPVTEDENYLFVILRDYITKNPAVGYSGQILPWINPFFWELINQNTAASSLMAEGMKNKLFTLSPLEALTELTDDDKKSLSASSFNGGKQAYAKAESESEKLQARFAFFKSQLTPLIGDFGSIGELAVIVPGLADEVKDAALVAINILLRMNSNL